MKTYSYFCVIAITFLLLSLHSCHKETLVDPVPPLTCEITAPADSAVIQKGNTLFVDVIIGGFGEGVKVSYSVDNVQVYESSVYPYTFGWNTEEWNEGIYTLRADAYENTEVVGDQVNVIIIDTIIPPSPPVAFFDIIPDKGTTDTIFTYDASQSYDANDKPEDLLFRWDFDGDGQWDTEHTNNPVSEHKFTHVGHYYPVLEVMDTDSMTADTMMDIVVNHSSSPDPCKGQISFPYNGRIYHTVPIGEQCWMRENLDVGMMIPSSEAQSDNQVIEKYCYDDDSLNCEKYGGLYTWKEMMKHSLLPGARGICPNGWHLPDDGDWKVLEGFIDSQHDAGDPVWDEPGFRGTDAGKRIKAQLSWISGGNGNNLFGFKALAAGYLEPGSAFTGAGEAAMFWGRTGMPGDKAYMRGLKYDEDGIMRAEKLKEHAFSVRCIKD